MKHFLFIVCLLATCAAGCARTRVVTCGDLPVYGADPLMHTVYTGTDDRFHHFAVQRGKSGGNVVVRREEAQIKPEPFDTNSGRQAFVKAARPGEIELLVFQPARQPHAAADRAGVAVLVTRECVRCPPGR